MVLISSTCDYLVESHVKISSPFEHRTYRNQGAFKAAETAQMSNNREVRDKDSKCTFSHHNLRSIDSLPNRCSHRRATFTDGFLSFVPEALYLHLHLTSRNGQEMNCAKVFITVKCDIRVCYSFSLLN